MSCELNMIVVYSVISTCLVVDVIVQLEAQLPEQLRGLVSLILGYLLGQPDSGGLGSNTWGY